MSTGTGVQDSIHGMMEACIWITPFFPHSKSSVLITAQTKKKENTTSKKQKKRIGNIIQH
jgi:hypothetical protein